MSRAAFFRIAALACVELIAAAAAAPAWPQLRGHGGPVRALAVSADGTALISGSFDNSAILWSLPGNAAVEVLRVHEGAVNAVALLGDGRPVTAGEDGRIALWTPGRAAPDTVLAGHAGPIAAIAASPDGAMLASASWDRTIRLWPLGGGPPRVFEGHGQNVNGVAFTPDGSALVSVGYDATMRIWPRSGRGSPVVANLASPLNAVVVAPDGETAVAGADGRIFFLSANGERLATVDASPSPIVALAISRDGARIGAASIGGPVAIVDRKSRSVAGRLAGPGLPAWSVAFLPDRRTILTGGADGTIRRWDAASGEPIDAGAARVAADPLARYAGDPGARVFRACVACHTLGPDQGNRAGPTLHGLFGRRIASLPGYNFSKALKALDIVWTARTVSELFAEGPAIYIPGTKMPNQRIGAPGDRAALVDFLARATK
jgi:cytochrome c